jgi:pentatricopeptide repeat protein
MLDSKVPDTSMIEAHSQAGMFQTALALWLRSKTLSANGSQQLGEIPSEGKRA